MSCHNSLTKKRAWTSLDINTLRIGNISTKKISVFFGDFLGGFLTWSKIIGCCYRVVIPNQNLGKEIVLEPSNNIKQWAIILHTTHLNKNSWPLPFTLFAPSKPRLTLQTINRVLIFLSVFPENQGAKILSLARRSPTEYMFSSKVAKTTLLAIFKATPKRCISSSSVSRLPQIIVQ